ncbi:MAG: flavin reductase family protein [Bacillota bacterium]|nr:flavin reductase family protein [Bacillota bacterium]
MSVNFIENMELGMEHLHKKGAFLTTKSGEITNTMTISWGNIGFEWSRPVFTAMVRKSRYTHEIIEKSNEFTVSIPLNEDAKKALAFCGTKSGREFDKFKECNLNLEDGKILSTPIIGNCELHYECKVVFKQEMDPALIDEEIKNSSYGDNNYHTIYFGEIVACYKK